jgi:hypothetical protein
MFKHPIQNIGLAAMLSIIYIFMTPGTGLAESNLHDFGDKLTFGWNNNYQTETIYMPVKSSAITMAPARQLYADVITKCDRQHYTVMGRQIVYAGYYNPAWDYVYMNYVSRLHFGATVLYDIRLAVFDWSVHAWSYIHSGLVSVSTYNSYDPNIDVIPYNGETVVSYWHGQDNDSPWYSIAGFQDTTLTYKHTVDTLAGPPNTENINTGFCEDTNPEETPYIYPIIDIDVTDDTLFTHVAACERPRCADQPSNAAEPRTLIYYRKAAHIQSEPGAGNWEGPIYMDSSNIMSALVRADKREGQRDVYYAYLKPIYYYYYMSGDPHYCTDGLEHYRVTNEVVYRTSTNNGATWGSRVYVTDYANGFEEGKTEPAAYDLSGFVDPDGVFHLVWITQNRSPLNPCYIYPTCKMWHWDNSSNCISLAYDASHPFFFNGSCGQWNTAVAKPNISWCDGKLYISFTRFGAHAIGNVAGDYGAGDGTHAYINGDIMVVATDAYGLMGKVWSQGVNLTDTDTDMCEAGDCFSEHWASMAMYSTDSLMILYIEDKDPGAYNIDAGSVLTDNPVMFMTWPCFAMYDAGYNICYSTLPEMTEGGPNLVKQYAALAPNGQSSGCVNPAACQGEVLILNCGNISLNYSATTDTPWLSLVAGASGSAAAGCGPRGSDELGWDGAPGCASPASIVWEANSASLSEGYYTGVIQVDFADAGAADFEIEVNLMVSCDYKSKWTILAYSNADCNAEEYFIDDFNEMEDAGSNEHTNIINQIDRHKLEDLSNYNWTDCRRYRIIQDYDIDNINSLRLDTPPDTIGEVNMCNPHTLADFVTWGCDNYPAEHYAIIILSHGNGWYKDGEFSNDCLFRGFGSDNDPAGETDNFFSISQHDLDTALVLIKNHLGKNIDILAFNTCLMQMWEVMDVSCKYVDYLVGSEEVMKTAGYKYDAFLSILKSAPDLSPEELGYYIVNESVISGGQFTLSCVDLSKTADLTIAVDEFAGNLNGAMLNPQHNTIITDIREQLHSDSRRFRDSLNSTHYYTHIDLYYFADKVTQEAALPQPLRNAAEAVKSAVTNAVTKITNSPAYNWAHGIAIYYPRESTLYQSSYDNLAVAENTLWDEFISGDYGDFVPGDANADGIVNVSDAVHIINYVFCGGSPPDPYAAGDCNCDGIVNVSDAVWIINYVFAGGPAPGDC